MKSILLIADFASVHIYNYIKNTIDSDAYKIQGLSMSPLDSIPSKFSTFYKEFGITLIEEATQSNDTNTIKIRKIYNQLKSLGPFDFLHIHYVKHLYTPGIYLLRKNYHKIILTFWGSDFYRSSLRSRICIMPVLRVANQITFITPNMRKQFIMKSIFHRGLNKRIGVLDYGNMLFPYIDKAKENIKHDKLGSYSVFNLDSEKITVTIGYVGRPQMQQKEAIDSILKNISNRIIEKIRIVIPAYGMEEDRVHYLQQILSSKGISHIVISKFLGPKEVALLRSLTDIFVHPQTTDAFSSSMQEFFYADAIIINGSWLQYNDVKEAGAYFLSFEKFETLPKLLTKVIDNIEIYKQKSTINKHIMQMMCSWDKWRQEWKNLYL